MAKVNFDRGGTRNVYVTCQVTKQDKAPKPGAKHIPDADLDYGGYRFKLLSPGKGESTRVGVPAEDERGFVIRACRALGLTTEQELLNHIRETAFSVRIGERQGFAVDFKVHPSRIVDVDWGESERSANTNHDWENGDRDDLWSIEVG